MSFQTVQGLKRKSPEVVATSPQQIDSEDIFAKSPEQINKLCTDDSFLKYLHFNANRGITSFKGCDWVGEDPYVRCTLEATNGVTTGATNGVEKVAKTTKTSGRRRLGRPPKTSRQQEVEQEVEQEVLLLKDFCPLSCGLCPTAPLPPQGELIADNLTLKEFMLIDLSPNQLEIFEDERPRPNGNGPKKPKKVKPCDCPGADHNGDITIGPDDKIPPTQTPPPTPTTIIDETPTPTLPPTQNPTLPPSFSSSSPTTVPAIAVTSAPTASETIGGTNSGTSSTTSSETSSETWSGSTGGTSIGSFGATTSGTTSVTTSATTSGTSTGSSAQNAAIDSIITGQQSSLNNRSRNRKLAIFLSVVPILILLLVCCCLLRRKKRRAEQRKNAAVEDTDNSDDEEADYPIHKTKSADSIGSRFKKAFAFFNGRQDDERTDVRRCNSSFCNVCGDGPCDHHSPRRILSVDSFDNQTTATFFKPGKDRYRMANEDRMSNEVEC